MLKHPIKIIKFICIYCGADSHIPKETFRACPAPDGDGHLFQRLEINDDKTIKA